MMIAAIVTGAFITGCVTMPNRIDPAFLAEATADQNAQIQQFNQDIIKKRDECDVAKKALETGESAIGVSKEQVKTYEQNGQLLNSQMNLLNLQGSADKVDAAAKGIDLNNRRIVQEKANTDYLSIYRDQLVIEKDLRDLELANLLGKADLLKAKIAFDFQMKRHEKEPIKVETYQKYVDDLAKQLFNKQEEQKKAADKTARAKDALTKTGYGAQ
jgi:outer membrane murein-binding lipoprotein Lpp